MVEDFRNAWANYWDKRSFKLCFLHNCTVLISIIAVFVLWSRGRRSRPKIVISLVLLSLYSPQAVFFQARVLCSLATFTQKHFSTCRDWLNCNAMFYETFICFYVNEAKPLCFSLCSQMFYDIERCWIYNIQNVCHANEQLSVCYFFSINVL